MTALLTSKGRAARRRALEAHRRAARRSLAHAVRWLWPVLNPGVPLTWGWHVDAMAEVCQAQAEGHIDTALINVPPGTTKSTTVSRIYPVWLWLRMEWASRGLMFMSHDYENIACGLQRDRLALMSSARYQWLMPRDSRGRPAWETTVAGVTRIETTARGFQVPYSYRQGPTGIHPWGHIYDDPHASGSSSLDVAKSVAWIEGPASTRFADKRHPRVICVMQRIATGDASDAMRDLYPGLVHLELPMEYDPKRHCDLRGHGLKFADPRTRPAELLPVHDVDETVAAGLKRDARKWATEFQQSPIAGSGNIFDERWWRRWREIDSRARLVGVIDATMGSKGRRGSYLCIAVAALQTVRGETTARWVDVLRKKASWPETEAAARFMAQRFPRCSVWLVEEKKFGKALIDTMRGWGLNVVAVKPEGKGDKEQRAAAVVPFVRDGLCLVPALDAHRPPHLAPARPYSIPRTVPDSLRQAAAAIDEGDHHKARLALLRVDVSTADRTTRVMWDAMAAHLAGSWGPPGWLDEWMDEHKAFPNSGNDDQVDTTTMVLGDHPQALGRRLAAALTNSTPAPSVASTVAPAIERKRGGF